MPSRARAACCWLGVGGQPPVDGIRQAPAQAAHRFHAGLPGGELALVVGAARSVIAQLDDACHIQHVVQPAIPGAGQAVAGVLSAGGVDGGGASPGGEVVAVGEAGDVADVGEDSGGTGGADPVDVHQV